MPFFKEFEFISDLTRKDSTIKSTYTNFLALKCLRITTFCEQLCVLMDIINCASF